jgi:hypothetical protein
MELPAEIGVAAGTHLATQQGHQLCVHVPAVGAAVDTAGGTGHAGRFADRLADNHRART